MFAFALWDRRMKTLVLARDRLGIKPLYYAATPERVLFASQLKAFRAVPRWQPTIDEDAVVGYLRHAYIAQPRTIYREASKLAPGHVLTLRQGARASSKCYSDLRSVALAGLRRNDPAPDTHEAAERLDVLLRNSIKLRIISTFRSARPSLQWDQPSTVVALMPGARHAPGEIASPSAFASGYDEATAQKKWPPISVLITPVLRRASPRPQRHSAGLPDWFDEPLAGELLADPDLSRFRADPQTRNGGTLERRRGRIVRRL